MPTDAPTWEDTEAIEEPKWDDTTPIEPRVSFAPAISPMGALAGTQDISDPEFRKGWELGQMAGPLASVPRVEGKTTAGKLGAAAANVALQVGQGVVSTPGLALGAIAPIAPKVLLPAMGVGFGAPMAAGGLKDVMQGTATGDLQQALEGAGNTLIGGGMIAGAAAGIPRRVRPTVPEITGKELVLPKGATPSVEPVIEPKPAEVAPEVVEEPAKPASAKAESPEVSALIERRRNVVRELDELQPITTALQAELEGHPELAGQTPFSREPRAEALRNELAEINGLLPTEIVEREARQEAEAHMKQVEAAAEWKPKPPPVASGKEAEPSPVPPAAEGEVSAKSGEVTASPEPPAISETTPDEQITQGGVVNLSPSDKNISPTEKGFRATAQGQKAIASRASRIATLLQVNEAIRKMDPNEAYTRELLQSLPDSQIDAMRDSLVADYNKLLSKKKTSGPEIVGMGGAVPGEFAQSQQTPTGIKNAIVDQERVKRGLPAAMQAARRTFGEVWDRAMALIDQDPTRQDALIDSLRNKPRALTDQEDALLLHRQIDLQNEYGKATRALAQAFDDGRLDQVAELKARVSEWSDKLQDLYDITKSSGTETGRGLAARKMLAYEDFTLAKLETETRAAKGGAPLTDVERAHLADVEKRFNETQKAFDDYVKQSQARMVELELKRQMAQAAADAKAEPKIPEIILKAAERLVTQLDSKADAARARIKARMSRVSAGLDPTVLIDVAEIGASHIAHIGLDTAKWSAAMIKDLGEWVAPYLDEAFKLAQSQIDHLTVPETVKRVVKKVTPQEQKTAFISAIKDKAEKNKKDEIPYYVRKLSRLFYLEGITEREAMVDALHKAVAEAIPGISRREVMDAFSGYGDYKQLSKEAVTVALRGMKGELQQISKLEDMGAGKPPLKSGVERRSQTEAERQLIKLVNDAKYKFQVPVADPETQLKSALDTLKTTLRNRITDYQDRLARKDFAPRERREIIMDREAQNLKAQNERVRIQYQRELNKYRLAQRGWPQKVGDAFVKWERAFKLSSPVVFGKLAAAATTRLVTTGVEGVLGGVTSKIPGIATVARQAPREGLRGGAEMAKGIEAFKRIQDPAYDTPISKYGANVRAMAVSMAQAFTEGMKDAKATAKTGETTLDVLLGTKGGVDADWANFFGQLHGMMKAPIKRFEYTLSLQKRLAWEISHGTDVTDPMVQMRLMTEALNDGYRTIFMQHGFSTDMFNALVRMMEQSKKYPNAGYISAKTLRFFFPIVRVPVNIVAETATGAHGLATASARVMFHLIKRDLDKLDPQTADSIMRQFKKGSIGAALIAIGYLNPQNVGGYDWREKRRIGSAKTGGFQIRELAGVPGFGQYGDVPKWMTHAPWFELMQIGATMRRVKEQHVKGHDKGLSEGAWAAALGLADEVPFYGQLMRAARASETGSGRGQFIGELGRSTLIPQAVQQVAKITDTAERRKPRTFGEHLKMGIPGLREEVPVAPRK